MLFRSLLFHQTNKNVGLIFFSAWIFYLIASLKENASTTRLRGVPFLCPWVSVSAPSSSDGCPAENPCPSRHPLFQKSAHFVTMTTSCANPSSFECSCRLGLGTRIISKGDPPCFLFCIDVRRLALLRNQEHNRKLK